jgi:hypothetical protein
LLIESVRLAARLRTLSDEKDTIELKAMLDADGIGSCFPIPIVAWTPAAR